MRWIIRIVAVLVSLVLLGVSALFLIPAERLAGIAAQQFQVATGRSMAISGSVRPSIYPVIGARVEGVRIDNAPWSDAGPMLEADAVDLGLDLAALIRGELIVRRFEAQGPRILLERQADGRMNWVFERLNDDGTPAPSTASAGDGRTPALSIDLVEIRGAALRFIDHVSGTDLRLDSIDADLRMPEPGGAGTFALSGLLNGQRFASEAEIGTVLGFLAGDVAAVRVQLEAGAAEARFEGRAGLSPLAAEGRATLNAPTLAPLLALAGQTGPEPLPAAARPLNVSGQVTLAPAGSLHLRDTSVGFGANRTRMALDLTFDGPRPRLSGDITADALDLRGLTGPADTPAAPADLGWSRERIDASAVDLLDAAVTLRAGAVRTDFLDLDAVNAVLTIDRARAVFDLREIRLFEGRATGEFVVNNRSGLSVGGNLRADTLALLPLIRQFADFERLTGTGSAELRFLGVGNSLDAIMRSLSGEGRLALDRGEIIGLDLAGMLRNMDMSYMGEGNRTVYDSVTGSFAIQDGVLNNTDLQLASRLLTVDGRGSVDIGQQRLDYRVIPSAMRDAAGAAAIRVPLSITGPWSQPRFRLDLEGLAEERLREERERLEARAREEVQRLEAEARERAEAEALRRLGLERQEGRDARETLRDGARDRVEQEIGRGLRRLLGGD
ncbi:MAG: AsmA family protein [Pararhodobacter sp.]